MNSLELKIAKIVVQLIDWTKQGRLRWTQRSTGLSTEVGPTKLMIISGVGKDHLPTIWLRFYDKYGKLAYQFDDNFLVNIEPEDDVYRDYWEVMDTLYKLASNSATGADRTVDEVLSALMEGDVSLAAIATTSSATIDDSYL